MSYGAYPGLIPYEDMKHAAATSPKAVAYASKGIQLRPFMCMGYVIDDSASQGEKEPT